MKQDIIALAAHRFDEAQQALRDALILAKEGSINGTVNRLYYAAFYAARSLLATMDLDSTKHSGVISLFQRHFVKECIFDRFIGMPKNSF